jgi:hypothetical protein
MGYDTPGCAPVSVRRNTVMASVSPEVKMAPSCEAPMMATACCRFDTLPEFASGGEKQRLCRK